MRALTPKRIAATSSDEKLVELLGRELQRRFPEGQRADDAFVRVVRALPRGLRAMAATYQLDVSLALDDLGWHFGNWHHKGLAEETALGLDELGAKAMARVFREAYEKALANWAQLGRKGWTEWYGSSKLEKSLDALNKKAWALQRKQSIMEKWAVYARKHPERVV